MISKTIGFRGTLFSDKPMWEPLAARNLYPLVNSHILRTGKIHQIFHGKIHCFYGHFQLQNVSSPEGTYHDWGWFTETRKKIQRPACAYLPHG